MKHLKKTRKFHREAGQRKALLKALITALITNGKIKTTEAKAKELRPRIEKMISKAKTKDVNAMRIIRRTLAESVTKKLFNEVAAKYTDRNGGYTRVVKLGQRRSDGSKMAQIEFV